MLRIASPLLLATLALGGCVVHDNTNSDSTLTVTNESDRTINELYITHTGDPHWGPNVLGKVPLLTGDSVLLDNIPCDTYDTLLVDATGARCEVDGVSLCFSDADWVIRNNTCDIFALVPGAGSPSDTPRTVATPPPATY